MCSICMLISCLFIPNFENTQVNISYMFMNLINSVIPVFAVDNNFNSGEVNVKFNCLHHFKPR